MDIKFLSKEYEKEENISLKEEILSYIISEYLKTMSSRGKKNPYISEDLNTILKECNNTDYTLLDIELKNSARKNTIIYAIL